MPPPGAAVDALVGRLGRALASALAASTGVPTAVTAWRAARSTWGQVRMTLTRSARSLVMPGVPGGAVLDPDPALAAQAALADAAGAAIRGVLTPPGRAADAPADRRTLPDDLGVLVLAFELTQGRQHWRLRVCLPSHTLAAVVRALAAPPPPQKASRAVAILQAMAREHPERLAAMLREWLAEDDGDPSALGRGRPPAR